MSNEYRNPGSGWYVAAATSCSLRSARILSGLTLFLLLGGFVFFVVDISDWDDSSVPIVGDSGLILARRVDTWVAPYSEGGGIVFLI